MALPTNFPNGVASYGITLPSSIGGLLPTTGDYYFVDSSTGSNSYSGKSKSQPFADLDYAIGRCTASKGDTIFVMPGHSEDVTTQIDCDVAGIRIIGLGEGDNRPSLKNSLTSEDQTFKIDADDVLVYNMRFIENDTAATPAHVELAAGADDVAILGCTFSQGANDLRAIEITGAIARLKVQGCSFYVSANGPDYAIHSATGATSGLILTDCYFYGMSTTNSWDNGAVLSDQADVGVYIDRCQFVHGASGQDAITFSSASSSGIIGDVNIAEYAEGLGISASQLARTKAIDVQIPTDQFSVVAQGTSLPFTSGKYIFVDSGTGNNNNDGYTVDNPKATIAGAVTAATASSGDVIVVFPNHSETLTSAGGGAAGLTIDKAGVKIMGISSGGARPSVVYTGNAAAYTAVNITATAVAIDNLSFGPEDGTQAMNGIVSIATALSDVEIKNCSFVFGANDRDGINFAGTSTGSEIYNNEFRVTANGPDRAIEAAAGVLTNCKIFGNIFNGMSTTNSWDDSPIFSDQVNVGLMVYDNKFAYLAASTPAVNLGGTAAEGVICGNQIAGNGDGQGIATESMLVFDNTYENTAGLVLQSGVPQTTGKYIYVSSVSGNANGNGLTPSSAVATLTQGIAIATSAQGDKIILMSGHAETPGVSVIINKAGITVLGIGEDGSRPTFTPNATVAPFNVFEIENSAVTLDNIAILAESSGNNITNQISLSGSAAVEIKNCSFTQGANDPTSLLFNGAVGDILIHDNIWIVTANGPDRAISATVGALTNCKIFGNIFNGMSTTNSWDDGAINSDQANSGLMVYDNDFLYLAANTNAINLTSATAEGAVYGNRIAGNDDEDGIAAPSMLVFDNIFENTSGMVLQSGTPRTTGKYVFVDSGTGGASNNGLSPATAVSTLDAAVALCGADQGDVIVVMPGHAELVNTTVTALDVAGIKVLGLGEGSSRPTFRADCDVAFELFTIDASRIVLDNIIIAPSATGGTPEDMTNMIGIAAGVDSIIIKNCQFRQGQYDINGITADGGISNLLLENNTFIVSADGPDNAFRANAGFLTSPVIKDNVFNGGSQANAYDDAAIDSDQVNTQMLIANNKFNYAAATKHVIELTGASTGLIVNNYASGVDYGYGIDPGSCGLQDNFFNDDAAVDARAIPFPTYSAYDPVLGYKVTRAAGDVIDSVQNAIFTVSGGRVLLTSFMMEITAAAIAAGLCNVNFVHDATAGGDTNLCAVLDIDGDGAGAIYSISGLAGDALIGGTGAASSIYRPVIVPEGQIDIASSSDGGSGGAQPIFELWYKPLDAGAVVVAA